MAADPFARLPWSSRSAGGFNSLDPRRILAILPIAGTDQHGPTVPLSTDLTPSAVLQTLLGDEG